jgi:hypothetical protein
VKLAAGAAGVVLVVLIVVAAMGATPLSVPLLAAAGIAALWMTVVIVRTTGQARRIVGRSGIRPLWRGTVRLFARRLLFPGLVAVIPVLLVPTPVLSKTVGIAVGVVLLFLETMLELSIDLRRHAERAAVRPAASGAVVTRRSLREAA